MEELSIEEQKLRDYIKRLKIRREKAEHVPLTKEQKEMRQNLIRLLSSDFSGCDIKVEVVYTE